MASVGPLLVRCAKAEARADARPTGGAGELFGVVESVACCPPGGAVLDAAFAIDDADLARADAEADVVVAFAQAEAEEMGRAKCFAVRGEDALNLVANGRVKGFDPVFAECGKSRCEGAVERRAVVAAGVDDVADDGDGVSVGLH